MERHRPELPDGAGFANIDAGPLNKATVNQTCTASHIDADTLEALVWSEVVNTLNHPRVLIRDLQQHVRSDESNSGEEIEQLEKEIENLRRQELNYDKMAAAPDFDVEVVKSLNAPVFALRREREREKSVLDAQLARQHGAVDFEKQLVEYCQNIGENIGSVTDFDGKHFSLAVFDVRVRATKDEIEITANVNPDSINYMKNTTTIARTLASPHARIRHLERVSAHRDSMVTKLPLLLRR